MRVNGLNNIIKVQLTPTFSLWFSYSTLVGVEYDGVLKVIDKVELSHKTVTGRHLNMIDPSKTHRVKFEEVQEFLDDILSGDA